MRKLFIGVSALVLMSSAAYAQQAAERVPTTEMEPARFLVFFNLNDATLTPEGAAVVNRAADEYKRTGAARVAVNGYTDLSGSPAYNLALSQRRAEAVERELVRLGVPASIIAVMAEGENDPLVPTADGVREPQNRRVAIEIPRPAPAPVAVPVPPPVAVAPQAGPPPAPKWAVSLGGIYGNNFRETNDGSTSALAGLGVRGEYLVTPNVPISLEQDFLYGFQSQDDGPAGRSTLGVNLQGNLGAAHPYVGANLGGVYGKAVQDGMVAGPELGVKFDLSRSLFLYGKAAYDLQFRESDWDHGILFGGLGLGSRF